jgi:hypothetical protein
MAQTKIPLTWDWGTVGYLCIRKNYKSPGIRRDLDFVAIYLSMNIPVIKCCDAVSLQGT